MVRIVVDAMGSDTYPDPEIAGAVRAALHFQEEIILVGKEDVLRTLIPRNGA